MCLALVSHYHHRMAHVTVCGQCASDLAKLHVCGSSDLAELPVPVIWQKCLSVDSVPVIWQGTGRLEITSQVRRLLLRAVIGSPINLELLRTSYEPWCLNLLLLKIFIGSRSNYWVIKPLKAIHSYLFLFSTTGFLICSLCCII